MRMHAHSCANTRIHAHKHTPTTTHPPYPHIHTSQHARSKYHTQLCKTELLLTSRSRSRGVVANFVKSTHRTCRLQEGVLDMAVSPPVSARSLAVMRLPTSAHTLGAMLVMRVSTKSRMEALAAASASYSLHPCRVHPPPKSSMTRARNSSKNAAERVTVRVE